MKRNFKMSVSLALVGAMILGSLTPVFALVKETQLTNEDATMETLVEYSQDSSFTVTIPKLVTLDAKKTSTYEVTIEGDIASDEVVMVVPDEKFEMIDQALVGVKKQNIEATVQQDKKSWVFDEFETKGNGNITASGLSAGSWRGTFLFNIQLIDGTFANNTWNQIAMASQINAVPETWNVGDIKIMKVDGVDYKVAIIGKNHDTYADGSGTAPLTFQLAEVLNTNYRMNSTNTNSGSWKGSEMYNTLNTTIFDTIEDDVKNNIKEISKKANRGGADTETVEI